ncbi:MAG: isoleucine--tRNA ligase [Candidatus Omnitrophica bacterium]|nr:isoleucine--tRNA ligase [Candidatus Omnitrophota bacterium]
MEYKNTLNLPQTQFSMKANLTQLEPATLALWQELDIYEFLLKAREGKEKFILHDGPPYANGAIHTGHALNKILKDIVIKYKIMSGYRCPFIIGWDCHGLPVEHQLFKELKQTKHDVNIADFRKKAKDFALKFVDLQKEDFKHLGIFSDFNNPYLTLAPGYEHATIKLLEYLSASGYIYRGRKPVNWCATCETALAEAEVEYADKESHSIYFLFKVIDDKGFFAETNVHFLVWTTTPWTLVSNVAVAVQPNFEYCLVKGNEKIMIVAADLRSRLEEKFGFALTILKSFKGSQLERIALQHPFLSRVSQVVLADFVSREDGSGCVHIAPGHGEEDFSLTRHYDLPVIMPVNDKGIFEEPAAFKGKNIKEANETVIEMLTGNDALLKHERISHSYPHCWRCKNPIIFRATNQWFLKIDHNGLREKALKEIEKIAWFPSSGKERMRGMLTERPDWCLSRQRLWGVPIPAVKCKKCDEVTLDKEILAVVADIFRVKGSDSWFTQNLEDFLPKGFSCPKCGNKEFTKEFDILDVWFESGASFFAVVQNNPALKFPADMYLEGSDQHRGWFQVSLIPSVAKEGTAPFKTILTHGFVVDGEGRKMSKSLGNVIAPQEISKKYGAEILRLWSAYSDYSEDVKISDGIIKQLVDIYRKVRNTIRFIIGNLSDFNETENATAYDDLLEVDRYMLSRTTMVLEEITSSYDSYAFYKVCQKIFNFCNLDLSSFYLDILKDRLYTFSPKSKERRSCQFVLCYILKVLLKVSAPILSFTAEEAYAAWKLPEKEKTIFATLLDSERMPQWKNDALGARWEKIRALREDVLKEIEKHREQGSIGSSLEAAIELHLEQPDYDFYLNYPDTLREVFIVSKVTLMKGAHRIIVTKAQGQKCLRCWNWKEDVGVEPQFPDVCKRCATTLKGGHV